MAGSLASRAVEAPQAPAVVAQVLALPVADIAIVGRLRPIDPVWAGALGAVMAAEGQRTPIEVCRLPGRAGYLLVTGGHRLEGKRLTSAATINSIVVDNDAFDRRMAEVSENLWRKGLEPIDRAAFVAELVTLRKLKAGLDPAKDGRSVSANVRWAQALTEEADDATATIAVAYGFDAQVGVQIGLSARTIRNDLALHRRLLPDLIEQLRALPISSNAAQLAALTKLSDADQREVVRLMVSGDAKGVSEGVAMISQKPVASPEAKAWSAFFGGWSRMSAAKRITALRELETQGLPKGVRFSFEGEA